MADKVKNPYYVDESKIWFKKESGWPDEVPKNIEFPKITLYDMLKNSAQKWPEHHVMWFLDTFMSYAELKGHVDALATALHQLGVKKGEVVAILLPNSFQYVIAYYAITALGAIASGVNPTYKATEILHQLKATNAKRLIVLDALYDSAVAPIIDKSGIETVIATNIADLALNPFKRWLGKLLKKIPTGNVPSTALRFKDLLRTPANLPQVAIDPVEDAATFIMTGGTTGVPKAAVLTHFNVVSNCIQARAWLYKTTPGAVSVGILPLFHSFAMTCVMNICIHFGGWMMLFPRPPSMEEFAKEVIRLGPPEGTMFCGAEILFQRFTDYMETAPQEIKDQIAGKLTLCVSGAGPLHRPVQEKFERITGGRLGEGFGLTEATPVVSASPFWGNRKIGTVGLPFPGTEWKIMDAETATKELGLGEDQIGEVCVAGPQVMKGYLNQPQETAETIKDIAGKRYLLTGDIGHMDEHGQIVIRDRKKQLIKFKGYSVFPKEVEELVGQHEAVSEVAVAGIPDPEATEIIKAWVVLKPEFKGKVTTDALGVWCKDNLTHYKVPKLIEFKDELPKTLVGKVLRRVLQENDALWQQRMKELEAQRQKTA